MTVNTLRKENNSRKYKVAFIVLHKLNEKMYTRNLFFTMNHCTIYLFLLNYSTSNVPPPHTLFQLLPFSVTVKHVCHRTWYDLNNISSGASAQEGSSWDKLKLPLMFPQFKYWCIKMLLKIFPTPGSRIKIKTGKHFTHYINQNLYTGSGLWSAASEDQMKCISQVCLYYAKVFHTLLHFSIFKLCYHTTATKATSLCEAQQ